MGLLDIITSSCPLRPPLQLQTKDGMGSHHVLSQSHWSHPRSKCEMADKAIARAWPDSLVVYDWPFLAMTVGTEIVNL